mgnify:CR=1 FL=1
MNINIILAVILAVFLIGIILWVLGFKNWLVWAVTEAEKVLGSGTGQLKLRYAYNLAVAQFPIMAKMIPFTVFSKWVDAALKVMRKMIEENISIAEAITNQIEGEYE